jgi:hypothetical protein
MRTIILLVIQLLLIQVGSSQSSQKTDWTADINFLAKELPLKHKDFFAVKNSYSFLEGLGKIKAKTSNLTAFQVAMQLQQLIASFGDSHTRLNYGQLIDKNKILPLQLYWFSDGLYVLHTTAENSEILGHQILAVNGFSIKTIADSLGTLVAVANESMLKKAVPEILPLAQVLEYFGFTNRPIIELTLKDQTGKIKTHSISPGEMTRQNRQMFKPDSLALCYKNERVFFVDYYLANSKTYYLQYNKCWSKELELKNGNTKNSEKLPSFREFEDRVFQTLGTESIDKIVFDLRFNGGGSSSQGTEFIKKVSKYLEKNPEVKMYVILGRHTFSSAIINALDFKKLTKAIFVGEEMAGSPNHFGEVKSFKLPSSGLTVDYSTKYFKLVQVGNVFPPDVKLETSFQDFKTGVDPAYEWIVRH